MDYRIQWGSIAAVQVIECRDELGPRQFWAIYTAEGKPADISPMLGDGPSPQKVTHAFPIAMRAFIDARFRDMFALSVESRQSAIDAHHAAGPVLFEGLNLTRVNRDGNGNPRYAVHFLQCLPRPMGDASIPDKYAAAIKAMNKIGGRKFHNRQYGGGIVFQSYSVDELAQSIGQATGRRFYPVID